MNWRYLIIIPCLVFLALYMGKFITTTPFSVLAILFCAFMALITFQNPQNGLYIIVFSMLLSPEIRLADVPGRALTVRVDDLLIIVLFIAWLAHLSFQKEWKGFVKTPLDGPIIGLLLLYLLGTAAGIIIGKVNPVKSLFYTLKYVEYFILYWTVVNIIQSRESLPRYLIAGLVTCVLVTFYAYSLFGKTPRVYAPFDSIAGGEPASLGGYYLVIFPVLFAFFLHVKERWIRWACLGLILIIVPPFARTFSRASYLAFVPMFLTLFILTKRRKLALGMMGLAAMIVFPLLFPGLYSDMADRVMTTFTGSHSEQYTAYELGSRKISDQSAIERIDSWQMVMREALKNPWTFIFGKGITGSGFIEGQFFLVLGELGILGVLLFYWLLAKIFTQACRIYRRAEDTVTRSLSLALAGCLVGMVFQSLTTNTFIIIRIMEPFWFLAALVMAGPNLCVPPATAVQLERS